MKQLEALPALKAWRISRGYSVAQVAEQFGVTQKSVYRWEEGTVPRSVKLLARIELVTGMTIQELFPEYFDPTK